MKNLCTLMLFSLLLGLFNGCGESFRTPFVHDTEDDSQALFDSEGNRYSYMDSSIDRMILNSYVDELQDQETSTVSLSSHIQAFDLILSFNPEERAYYAEARLLISCDEQYNFKVPIEVEVLQSMTVIDLGRFGDYEAEVRCTSNTCEEMVAAVRKYRAPYRGVVLVGLGIGGEDTNEVLYISRRVEYTPYFATFPNAQTFSQSESCSLEDSFSLGDGDITQLFSSILSGEAVQEGKKKIYDWLVDQVKNLIE